MRCMRDGWMRDFLNASIVSVVVAMDARAYSSFIARAFWFFYVCGVAIGGLTMTMTTTVGRFVLFSRAGRF